MFKSLIFSVFVGWWALGFASAELRLPSVFSDHVVLQRESPIAIWGWANAGSEVTITVGDAEALKAVADAEGRWSTTLPAMAASDEPTTITVSGDGGSLTVNDVLVGEVWLCSGQSNMEWTVASSRDAEAEIAAADHPEIRQIKIPHRPASVPEDTVDAEWAVCSPETAGSFTAVGYYFARELQAKLGVPVGLVNSSWGGTRIEPWVTPEAFAGTDRLDAIAGVVAAATPGSAANRAGTKELIKSVEAWLDEARGAAEVGETPPALPEYPESLRPLASRPNGHQQPTALYNGMVHPLVPFGIRGALWYQGESNHRDGDVYVEYKTALVSGWREAWGLGEFPFYFVQIAPYQYGDEPPESLAEFWEIQAAAARANANTEMVVINDLGEAQDIHPKNKQDVGLRLANLALADTYGIDGLGEVHSAEAVELKIENGSLRVEFAHAGEGLRTRDDAPPTHFEIMGSGKRQFVPAEAKIEGAHVVVLRSPEVPDHIAVRFAWNKLATPNLVNGAGLPVGAFRLGDHAEPDLIGQDAGEAVGMELVYDLDLSELASDPKYAIDRSAELAGKSFARVGYYLELRQKGSGERQWVWVSMDAFTDDASKLAVPTVASGAVFQRGVTGMSVRTNVAGVVTGEGIAGNLEFWSSNYGPENGSNIPGASPAHFDFGDKPGPPTAGHGSMQVHNTAAGQTVFAINRWDSGDAADIGIGNSGGDERSRDWTFTQSGRNYSAKRLRVFVR